jgi:hypothetical protein
MVRQALDERVEREFDRFAATQTEHVAAFKRLRDAFREYVRSAPPIVRRVQQCVAQGRPASFIRLGDGEGNLLALGMDAYPALTAYSAREVSIVHFGTPDVLLEARPDLRQDFCAAIRNAELIGFPAPRALPTLLKKHAQEPLDPRPIYGVGAVYAYLERYTEELGLAYKTGSVAGFNRLLLPHYNALIEGRDIGLVSCHEELPDGLRDRMGARSVEFYPVPEQGSPAFKTPTGNTGHYPARYYALLEELAGARAGIVYFVAAGILGKTYCEAIRATGGIALDIGAVADIWAGVRSRRQVSQETVDTWRIL